MVSAATFSLPIWITSLIVTGALAESVPSAAQPFNRAPPAKAINNERRRCHSFFIRLITRDNIYFTSKDADKDGGVID
jgi:hypothetical protein